MKRMRTGKDRIRVSWQNKKRIVVLEVKSDIGKWVTVLDVVPVRVVNSMYKVIRAY